MAGFSPPPTARWRSEGRPRRAPLRPTCTPSKSSSPTLRPLEPGRPDLTPLPWRPPPRGSATRSDAAAQCRRTRPVPQATAPHRELTLSRVNLWWTLSTGCPLPRPRRRLLFAPAVTIRPLRQSGSNAGIARLCGFSVTIERKGRVKHTPFDNFTSSRTERCLVLTPARFTPLTALAFHRERGRAQVASSSRSSVTNCDGLNARCDPRCPPDDEGAVRSTRRATGSGEVAARGGGNSAPRATARRYYRDRNPFQATKSRTSTTRIKAAGVRGTNGNRG